MKYITKDLSLHPVKSPHHPKAELFLAIESNTEIKVLNFDDRVDFARCKYQSFKVWFQPNQLRIVEE